MDLIAGPAVDIVHNLDHIAWPLDADVFGGVICEDVLEHLADIPAVMREMARVCVDGAWIDIKVPSATSPDVFTDPTHRRGFGYRSFDYFDSTKELYAYGYSDVDIEVASVEFVPQPGRLFASLDRAMARFANSRPRVYEDRFCHLYPMKALKFRLVVHKAGPSAT